MVGQEKESLVDDILQLVSRLEDIVAGRVVPACYHRQQPVEESGRRLHKSKIHSKFNVVSEVSIDQQITVFIYIYDVDHL